MVATTLGLLLLVAAGTAVLGTGLAWLVTAYEFPLRWALSWLLVLPLAMPAYILGFVFLSTFDYAGPVQSTMRSLLGADTGPLPVRSLGGAAIVLVLTLYPYVYLLTRAAFLELAPTAYDAARTLGASRARAFRTVLLPLAPPVAGGRPRAGDHGGAHRLRDRAVLQRAHRLGRGLPDLEGHLRRRLGDLAGRAGAGLRGGRAGRRARRCAAGRATTRRAGGAAGSSGAGSPAGTRVPPPRPAWPSSARPSRCRSCAWSSGRSPRSAPTRPRRSTPASSTT